MIKGIYLTADALQSRFKNIEVIANNIANINTSGFKRQKAFSEILMETGEKIVTQKTDFSQGELNETTNTLDFAIQGNGFFNIKTDNGIQLTRKGNFRINDEGYLINSAGDKVMGKNGEINFSDSIFNDIKAITVSKEGVIKVKDKEIDTILISSSDEEMSDRTDGLNFIVEATKEIDPSEYAIYQGHLEDSNASPLQEIQDMIEQNKGYESTAKMMGSLDQSLKQANEIGRI